MDMNEREEHDYIYKVIDDVITQLIQDATMDILKSINDENQWLKVTSQSALVWLQESKKKYEKEKIETLPHDVHDEEDYGF